MIARHDISVLYNGHPQRFRKGARVNAPDALMRALKEQGAIRAQPRRKAAESKENSDD